jgi:hypothetical protein
MPFIRINNRNNFLLKSVPNYHPDSIKYLSFWREQKKRVIEGFWGIDDAEYNVSDVENFNPYKTDYAGNKWRFCTPGIYFYCNFGTILHRPKGLPKTAPKLKVRPTLRDVDWEILYDIIEARGFSGFELDDEYTCCKDVISDDPQEMWDKTCFNSKGEVKKYIPAFEYLRKVHDKPLGLPLYFNGASNYMLLSTRELGKLLRTDELVRVKDGWKKIGELNVNDEVYSIDGTLSKVTNKTDLQTNVEMYKITLRDGREIECCEDHLWYVYSHDKHRNNPDNPYVTKSTKEMFAKYKRIRKDSKHKQIYGVDRMCEEYLYAIPNNKCISEDTVKELPLDPYLLGLLLGDGCITDSALASLTSEDEQIINYVKKSEYFSSVSNKENNKASAILFKTSLKPILKELGILGTYSNSKFIPKEYLFASKEQRLELLRGLNDTDAYSGNTIEYCTVSEQLAKDYQDLVRSLGMSCVCKKSKAGYRNKETDEYIQCQDRYRINLYTEEDVFKLDRKLKGIKKKDKAAKSKQEKTFITNIEYIGKGEGVCITVNNPTHTYITKDYIVTHNSYSIGEGVILHELLVDGLKHYNPEEDKPLVEIFVGSGIAAKSHDLMKKVQLGMDHLPGIWKPKTKDEIPSPFFKQMTGSILPNSKWTHAYEKKIGNNWVKGGTGSNITHGVWTSENPEAAAGGRYTVIVCEEVGLTAGVLTITASNEAAQKQGTTAMGSSLYVGTSGNMEKIRESEIIFKNPADYNMLSFEDEWEGTGRICRFIPVFYKDEEFKDDNGNTNLEAAQKFYAKRLEEKAKSKNRTPYLMELMNYPRKPSDMFLRESGNAFPVLDLQEHLKDIQDEQDNSLRVEFKIADSGEFIPKMSSKLVIKDYPYDHRNGVDSSVVIYEPPKKDNETGKVFSGRYIAGWDPTEDDNKMTNEHSLQSVYVMDLFTDRIVAMYTGRTYLTKDFYENVRRLLSYYNAICNYEKDKKGPYAYFDQKNSLYLLATTPAILAERGLQKINNVGNEAYGTRCTLGVIKLQIDFIKDYLETKIAENNERKLLHTIRDLALIKELIAYNAEGNFDRVRAFGQLMILRADRLKYVQSMKDRVLENKKKNRYEKSIFHQYYYGNKR